MFDSRFRESKASLVKLKENGWIHTLALEIWPRRFQRSSSLRKTAESTPSLWKYGRSSSPLIELEEND